MSRVVRKHKRLVWLVFFVLLAAVMYVTCKMHTKSIFYQSVIFGIYPTFRLVLIVDPSIAQRPSYFWENQGDPAFTTPLFFACGDLSLTPKRLGFPYSLFTRISPSKRNGIYVTALIQHGANVNQQNVAGDTPLHVAANQPQGATIVKELLSFGADPTIQGRDGKTPLDLATEAGNKDIVAILRNNIPEYAKPVSAASSEDKHLSQDPSK